MRVNSTSKGQLSVDFLVAAVVFSIVIVLAINLITSLFMGFGFLSDSKQPFAENAANNLFYEHTNMGENGEYILNEDGNTIVSDLGLSNNDRIVGYNITVKSFDSGTELRNINSGSSISEEHKQEREVILIDSNGNKIKVVIQVW